MTTYLDLFYIISSIIVSLLLFQLSSYLGQTILSTGISSLEIEDIADLLGVSSNSIRMIPLSNERVKFKILNNNENFDIGYIIFNANFLKVLEKNNISFDINKLNELRRLKFSKLIRVDEKYIKISDDGNKFMQLEDDNIIGSVEFDDNNELQEVIGVFKKYF